MSSPSVEPASASERCRDQHSPVERRVDGVGLDTTSFVPHDVGSTSGESAGSSSGSIVIVGGGMAAARLVEGLVARGLGPQTTVLAEEQHAP